MRISMIGVKGIPISSTQGGGIERHVENLATKLVERGHHVTVYVRPYANPLKKKYYKGVRLITLPTIKRKHFDAIVHTFFSSIHVLFEKADIVHYHAVGPSLLSWIPRVFKPRSKVVVTFHSRDRLHDKWNWFARFFLAIGEWTACRFPHLTIAVSHGIQLFCEQMYARKAVYIPNAVDVPNKDAGTSFLKAEGLKPNEYLITLGRLIPLKAQDDAIKAFHKLNTAKKLLIIGEPAYDEPEYQAKLEELAKADPRVMLMGYRSGVELKQLIANCYCMIHPSRIEGLSLAVLEAMSYGRLVVMSDIPENRELVDHSGVAFPMGRIKELSETLRWLLSDPVLVHVRGDRARSVVSKLYSWQHIVLRTEAEFDKLIR